MKYLFIFGAAVLLILAILVAPYFVGIWSCNNTSEIVSHYSQEYVNLPKLPFIVGSYLTQLGIPYWVVTEIWKNII